DIQQGHAYRVRVQLTADLPETPVYAHADYQRLTQTFNNLLAHAIHSTAPDGQVDVRLYQQSDRAFIDIEDDGPALDPSRLAYIFEPFFQPSEGAAQRTGVGLALARQIVEHHGGHIAASSTVENNRMTVQLPLGPDPD
ncbi:MAG: ATP-binding protein, partial [Chloroflexi bacterium]